MGRSPCCSKEGMNRGAWTALEDKILTAYIKAHGEGKWRNLPKRAGLKRCGKSCRLRWLNYLRPDIKRGNISNDEEELIIRLHNLLGNRWSLIAGRLPGRTDNEIKNYWNTTLAKKAKPQSSSSPPPSNQIRNKKSQKIKSSEPKARNKSKPSLSASSESADDRSKVIRTKATRCTKVIIPTVDLQVQEQSDLLCTVRPNDEHFLAGNGPNSEGIDGGDGDGEYLLPLDESFFNNWNATNCLGEENANFDLDSLQFFLDSDEWP
ncbi:hypothetical protein UlMin_035736 [Ulmus minor]